MYNIGQYNLQGAYVAQKELSELADKLDLNVLLQQHPYLVEGKVLGLEGRWKLFHVGEGAMAVVAVKKDVDVLFLRHLTCAQHVTVTLGDEDGLTITSSYFQYRDQIEDHIRRWEEIIRGNLGRRMLLAGDVNARSPQRSC